MRKILDNINRHWSTLAGFLGLLVTTLVIVNLLTGCAKTSTGVSPIASPGNIGVQAGTSPSFRRASDALPGSLPSLDEEVWIIARGATEPPPDSDETPGCGAMVAEHPDTGMEVPLPLKHTDVKATVSAYIATVSVTQQFHNPYDGKIEAVYVFPLPQNAAVNEFVMIIGERRIRGIIRERQEAERIYNEAKRQGYVASLLTQERPNIFTQSVANIEPGEQIDVNIRYFHTLDYDNGWYEFVFPMVVGPRFNPPGWTDGVGAVARGLHGVSGQETKVQYLKPSERSGHDIDLQVDINTGVSVEEYVCPTHAVSTEAPSEDHLRVKLSRIDRIPNKDFVLRYRVAGQRIKPNLLTHLDQRGGYFTLMVYPPEDQRNLARQPLELVFVLDCSGSMSGQPLKQAKLAVERALGRLQPDDSFQIIRFSSDASKLGRHPLSASPQNVRKGLSYLKNLKSQGGTMMIEGIRAALDFPHDPERLRFVCFLTDGYIGNESQILGELQERLGTSRIFSFGIGSSVNRYLMEHMAKVGRGVVSYLGSNDNASQIMDAFMTRISYPAMTNVRVDWGGWKVSDVYPRTIPDLFVGRPIILTGRFQGNPAAQVRVAGQAGKELIELPIIPTTGLSGANQAGLPSVWARMKISDLSDLAFGDPGSELAEEIKQVALDYGLMSAYTAFVAVDSSRHTEGKVGTTVPVAVPVPDGVRYETTVTAD